jgi:hypothetical protein
MQPSKATSQSNTICGSCPSPSQRDQYQVMAGVDAGWAGPAADERPRLGGSGGVQLFAPRSPAVTSRPWLALLGRSMVLCSSPAPPMVRCAPAPPWAWPSARRPAALAHARAPAVSQVHSSWPGGATDLLGSLVNGDFPVRLRRRPTLGTASRSHADGVLISLPARLRKLPMVFLDGGVGHRVLQLAAIVVGPMPSGMCYCRVRRRSR